MPDHPAIELTDVSLRHGRTLALDGVSATIPAGSVTGLVGRNGAGKTSLLRVIAGREPRHTGRVSVLAQPASRLGHTPGAVHLLCDTWGFAADLTVAGVGAHLRRLGGPYDQDRARDLLDRFGVPHDAPVGRLSRGQASAARLSLALASRAPITLLDEPTLGMDAAARALTTRVVIEELAEAPRTLVISTHLIDEAAPLFEHLLVLDRGRIVAHCDIETMLGRFARAHADPATLAGVAHLGPVDRLGGRATTIVEPATLDAAVAASLHLTPLSLQELSIALPLDEHAPARPTHDEGPLR